MKKYKKVQPTQKSIMADPRVEELYFERGMWPEERTAELREDRWWCHLVCGYRHREEWTTCVRGYTLKEIADELNKFVEQCHPNFPEILEINL